MSAASDFLKLIQHLNEQTTRFGATRGPAGMLNRGLGRVDRLQPPTMPTAIRGAQHQAVPVVWTPAQKAHVRDVLNMLADRRQTDSGDFAAMRHYR